MAFGMFCPIQLMMPSQYGSVVLFRSSLMRRSLLSLAYMYQHNPSCFILLTQCILAALAFALDKAGSSIAARIAMMAMTTSSSMSVKAALCGFSPNALGEFEKELSW